MAMLNPWSPIKKRGFLQSDSTLESQRTQHEHYSSVAYIVHVATLQKHQLKWEEMKQEKTGKERRSDELLRPLRTSHSKEAKSVLQLLVLWAVWAGCWLAGLQTHQWNISHATAGEVSLSAPKLLPVTKMLRPSALIFPGSGQSMSIEKFVLGTPLPLRSKTRHR